MFQGLQDAAHSSGDMTRLDREVAGFYQAIQGARVTPQSVAAEVAMTFAQLQLHRMVHMGTWDCVCTVA